MKCSLRCTLVGTAFVGFLFSTSAAPAEGSGYVFTSNEAANSLSRIDLSSGQIENVPLPIVPHNVDVMGKGQPLLVVGPMADHGMAGQDMAGMEGHSEAGLLAVLDPLDLAKPPRALIEVGEHPAHVVALADGSIAFVTNAGENTVGVIDLKAGQMVARIPTGTYPHGMRLSPDQSLLLIANVEDGSVSLIDVASRTDRPHSGRQGPSASRLPARRQPRFRLFARRGRGGGNRPCRTQGDGAHPGRTRADPASCQHRWPLCLCGQSGQQG